MPRARAAAAALGVPVPTNLPALRYARRAAVLAHHPDVHGAGSAARLRTALLSAELLEAHLRGRELTPELCRHVLAASLEAPVTSAGAERLTRNRVPAHVTARCARYGAAAR